MLPSHAVKPFSCISCGSSFKRSGDLASHLTQAAKCHWVLKKREQIQAAEIPDYREASDQESDPPAESDPFFPYEDMDVLAEDIFNEESPNEGQSSCYATNPQTNGQTHITVEEMLDEDDPDFYDADARSRMEDELDSEVVYYKDFPNAGKVYRTNGEVHRAYSKTGQHSDNPFHPFCESTRLGDCSLGKHRRAWAGCLYPFIEYQWRELPILLAMDLVFMPRYR